MSLIADREVIFMPPGVARLSMNVCVLNEFLPFCMVSDQHERSKSALSCYTLMYENVI